MDEATARAAALGFPNYVECEADSFPGNSSPYVLSRRDLISHFANDPVRLTLLQNLDVFLERLAASGIQAETVMIGGGFVRRIPERPSDLDGLVLYRLSEPPEAALPALMSARKQARARGLDLRFCAVDADTITMARSIAFFATLYSKTAGSLQMTNGLILYDRSAP